MAIYVVDEATEVDDTHGRIVVRSDSLNGATALLELKSAAARRTAIMKAATLGLASPGISGTIDAYPVDSSGKEVTKPLEQKVAAYQAEIPVTRKLV